MKNIIRGIWGFFLFVMLTTPLLFYLIKIDFGGWFGGLPGLEKFENLKENQASLLYSEDKVVLGKYFRENRTPVKYDELSEMLINTLLSTEDTRFYNHSGIDLQAIIRVVSNTFILRYSGGGSTVTMQLAENLFETEKENQGSLYKIKFLGRVITKFKEWIIAIRLEKNYTKEEVLTMYFNTLAFGGNAYGIQSAAKTFFNKLPAELNYQESAVLVGLINAPTRYSPVANPERSLVKRNEILYNLYQNEHISLQEYDSLKTLPIELKYRVDNHNEGLATYFRTVVRNYLLSWCAEKGYDLFQDGLKIYTTINSRMQEHAEESVTEHMAMLQKRFINHLQGRKPWINDEGKEIEGFIEEQIKKIESYSLLKQQYGEDSKKMRMHLYKKKRMKVFDWEDKNFEKDTIMSLVDSLIYYKHFLQAGFMAMDPHEGFIKAWVGGINHKYFKFDHVIQGKRQPGSTIKPFVYTAVIDNGYSPCFEVVDAPVTFHMPYQNPSTWTPKNSGTRDNPDGHPSGKKMTLRQAMARSVNSITAFWMKKLTPETVVEYIQRLGVKSPLLPVPSLCLGSGGDVSLYEMVGAYSTYVNLGTWIEPIFITRIEDEHGNVIEEFVPKKVEAISEATAYSMLYMLRGATEEAGGTALGISPELRIQNHIGGKTGTTQNASDGWFIGVTKNVVAGAWVGGDDRSIHFREWTLGQGGKTALPIWNLFMTKIYSDEELGFIKGSFNKPTSEYREWSCPRKVSNDDEFTEEEEDEIF